MYFTTLNLNIFSYISYNKLIVFLLNNNKKKKRNNNNNNKKKNQMQEIKQENQKPNTDV